MWVCMCVTDKIENREFYKIQVILPISYKGINNKENNNFYQ